TAFSFVEDKKLLRICLVKGDATAKNCWRSLLVDKYVVDPFTFDQMEKKLMLQRFQLENPGLDFSGATVDGNYHAGGPELPS
ncbi:nudC domain-containing protein 2-like, partial [Mizuhopecten yessoensis]|uniref:nudC domain-containing protein 2-like n=1 Tax=Mizuhopecten yessoensis TaxID=6573 RepID=UPI000B459B47